MSSSTDRHARLRGTRSPLLVCLALIGVWVSSCSHTRAGQRLSREQAQESLKNFEQVGLVIGEFPIDGAASVVDGDTIHVKGLQSSLRLLCIDTEETFKHDWERKAYQTLGFKEYVKQLRGNAPRPVKMATPEGDAAKKWAQGFFEGVTTVRLERDHPGEIRDVYGRYLAYVFVQKDGKWVNYNLEAVRAGWAPYFPKYGQSRRFHEQFVEAQKQAQEAKLHIWSDNEEHYPDYPERLAWWNERGAWVAAFEAEEPTHPEYVVLSRWNALDTLDKLVGKEATVLGTVNEVKLGDKGPSIVKMSRSKGSDFKVVFFDKDVLMGTGAAKSKGEFIQVRGVVKKYVDKFKGVPELEMVVNLPSQVQVSPSVMKLPDPKLVASDKETPKPQDTKVEDVKTVKLKAQADEPDNEEGLKIPSGILNEAD